MIVCLTGFMGCGKSTVGRALADRLGWEFVDLDEYVEHKKGFSIKEIFAREGEEVFRAIEAECVRDVIVMHQVTGGDVVVALGGGTLSIRSVQPIILGQTTCIWLRRSLKSCLEEIAGDFSSRPMLSSAQAAGFSEVTDNGDNVPSKSPAARTNIERLFAAREADYSKAPLIIDCDGKNYEQITEEAFEKTVSADGELQ